MGTRGLRNATAAWIITRHGKRGRSYAIRWIDPDSGKAVQEACGRDKAYARQQRDAKGAELRNRLSGVVPFKTLSDLESAVPTFYVGKSEHTVRKTRQSLKTLISLCGDRRLQRLNRGFIMEFRSRRVGQGARVATVNKDLRRINRALTYAVDANWLTTNPLSLCKAMQLLDP